MMVVSEQSNFCENNCILDFPAQKSVEMNNQNKLNGLATIRNSQICQPALYYIFDYCIQID